MLLIEMLNYHLGNYFKIRVKLIKQLFLDKPCIVNTHVLVILELAARCYVIDNMTNSIIGTFCCCTGYCYALISLHYRCKDGVYFITCVLYRYYECYNETYVLLVVLIHFKISVFFSFLKICLVSFLLKPLAL